MSDDMTQQFIRNGQFLIMDTTFNTNRYGFKLLFVAGIDHGGKSVILSCAVFMHETTVNFEWVLECMKKHVGQDAWSRVQSVATDGDEAMASAIQKVLPSAKQQRCIFHIMQNIRKNVVVQKQGGKSIDRLLIKFDTVAHLENEQQFEAQWQSLMKEYPSASNYLSKNIYTTREKWAKPWTRKMTNFGTRSTQRVECLNYILKMNHDITGGTYFHDLYDKVQSMVARIISTRNKYKNYAKALSTGKADRAISFQEQVSQL